MSRIHDGLKAVGIRSQVWCGLDPYRPLPEDVHLYPPRERRIGPSEQRWRNRVHRVGPKLMAKEALYEFNVPYFPPFVGMPRIVGPGEVAHLHWVTLMFDLQRFTRGLADDQPVVWTLHDENPFTGGCHYSWGCTGFTRDCRQCPQLRPPWSSFVAARHLDRVKRAMERFSNLHIVADSHWLESQARKSSALRAARSFRTIHYGLDHHRFQPGSKSAARAALGIDDQAFVMAFGAQHLSLRRKGGAVLREAVAESAPLKDSTLILFGSHGEFFAGTSLRTVDLGGDANAAKLVNVYNAADVFVMPSLEEAFGQTALEALACGTPVVGSATGGIVDMVQEGKTGLLVEPGSVAGLRRALEWCQANREDLKRMGAEGRKLVERQFTLDHQAKAYVGLYRDILGKTA